MDDSHEATKTESRSCSQHGDYVSTYWKLLQHPPGMPAHLTGFWSNCPTCNAEWAKEAEAKDAAIRSGATQTEMARLARLGMIGIPARFNSKSLWNWQHGMDQQKSVWDKVRDYVSHFELALENGRSMVLAGGPGTGKTHILCAVLAFLADKGAVARYTTMADLLARFKDTFNRSSGETERQVMESLVSPDMLGIDEVGKETGTGYDASQFFQVLNKRYAARKPIVLATNLGIRALTEWLGEAAIDRLREGGGLFLGFDWASQRSRRKPKEKE